MEITGAEKTLLEINNKMRHFGTIIVIASLLSLVGCGTLTGIPSHGGGKRFAIEQRLVSTTIRGALKQIDLAVLRDKTVFIQMTAINDQGGGNISGGRGNLLFGLQGVTESHPITRQTNTFKVFDLNSSGGASTSSSTVGGSSTRSGSNSDINIDTTSSNTGTGNLNSTNNGSSTSASTGTSTNTGTTNSSNSGANTSTSNGSNSGTSTSTGTSTTNGTNSGTSTTNSNSTNSGTSSNTGASSNNTTTTTGGTTTNQNGTGTSSNTGTNTSSGTGTSTTNSSGTNSSNTSSGGTTNSSGTNTSTTNGSNTNTGTSTSTNNGSSTSNTNGTNTNTGTQASSSLDNGISNTTQNQSVNGFVKTNNHSNTSTRTNSNGSQQALSSTPSEIKTQTKGTGYKGNYGFEYKGQGRYDNFNVAISDVGILRSILFTYLYLNDVNVTTDPNNPNIDAVVYVNVDVFGSIRSRLDTVVYNKETVQVQVVIEMMAVNAFDRTLLMSPQVGSYEATYDEKYVGWVGPYNKKKDRITHSQLEKGLLVDFSDLANQKILRDNAKVASFAQMKQTNTETIRDLEDKYRQLLQVRQQEQEIETLKKQLQLLQSTPLSQLQDQQPALASQVVGQLQSEQSVSNINEEHYTIQLMTGINRLNIEQYIIADNIQDKAFIMTIQRESSPLYVLLYGNYATLAQAQVVASNLPESVKRNQPWVRQIKQIKENFQPVSIGS